MRPSDYVRPTPGISCERPICSTLVCFIPLFGGSSIYRAIEASARTPHPG